MRIGRMFAVLGVTVLVAAACHSMFSSPAAAQGPAPPATLTDVKGYKYLTPFIDPALKPAQATEKKLEVSNRLRTVQDVIANRVALADGKAQFDYFYSHVYFPQFTLTTDKALEELPVERHRLLRNHLEACAVRAVHDYLANMVLTQMKGIVLDEYHPACRYNAMLVISGLNDVDAVRIGGSRATPEPMMAALPFIFEQYTKAGNTDAIKMAALLGLVRHLEWDNFRGPAEPPFTPAIPQPTRDAIVSDFLALALAKDPPGRRSAEGHEWFRRRAIEGLTHASHDRVNPAVASALDKLLKDETESLAIRCAAATAIGKVVYQAPATLEPKAMAKELGYLALVACDKELTRVANLIKAEEDKLQRMAGGGDFGGGMPGGIRGGTPGGVRGGSETGSSDFSTPSPRGGTPRGVMGGGGPGRGGGVPGVGRGGGPGGMPRGMGMMPGGIGGGAGMIGGDETAYGLEPLDPKQYRFDLIRRRIRAQLYAVEIGLSGPDANLKPAGSSLKPADAAAAPKNPPRGLEMLAEGKPDEVAAVKEIKEKVGKLVETVEGPSENMAALEKELRKHMKPLEGLTRKLSAPAATPVPADIPSAPAAPAGAAAAAPAAPAAAPPASPMPSAPAPAAPGAGAAARLVS